MQIVPKYSYITNFDPHPSEIQSKVGECHQKWLTATKCCPYTATYITVHRRTWTCPPVGIKLRSSGLVGSHQTRYCWFAQLATD